MFEFIEEPLQSPPTPPTTTTPPAPQSEGVVYTMPEKFLTGSSAGGSKKPLIIGAAVVGGLGILGTVGLLVYLSSTNQGSETPAPTPTPIEEITPPPSEQTPPISEPTPGPTPVTPPATPEATPTPPTTTTPPASVPLAEGVDTDRDLLTDVEELLYATDTQKPDTDDDGFLDGNEVRLLFDPNKGSSAKIQASPAVSLFKNAAYQFGFLYPTAWAARASDQANREILVSSATGEYFTISVMDNPNKLDASAYPDGDTSSMTSLAQGSWSGLVSADEREAYLTQKGNDGSNLPFFYVITYTPGATNTLNFKSTFMMVVRSILDSASLLPR